MPHEAWFSVLQYAGGGFAGWQRQPAARTVQREVEQALARLADEPVTVHAAGRTDTGVHALAQVVSFTLPRPWAQADLHRALNALLPDDIWSAEMAPAPAGFHARKQATARRYRYVVGCDAAARSPFRRPYEWPLGLPLDAAALEDVARRLTGEHDFRGFAAAGQPRPHYRCRVVEATWQERPGAEGFIFTIEADRFLHRMVRFLVGTTVDVALGRRPSDDVTHLLTAQDNRHASPPAPPEGLYLIGVRYPQFAKGFDA